MTVLTRFHFALGASLLAIVGLASTGCPAPNGNASAKVFVLLSNGGLDKQLDGASTKDNVELDEIESLTVTVTEVALQRAGDDAENDGDDQDLAKDEDAEQEIVFSGALDVDLMDLSGIAELIASSDVYPGRFTKIRLAIENPRLILTSDPEVVISNVQLTANGHLFVSKSFELKAGASRLLVLTLDDLHLVETGNGKYVLTPQLRADLAWVESATMLVGQIESVDAATGELVVIIEDGTAVTVTYAAAPIFLPTDTDTATGTEADLVEGVEIEVQGTLWSNGSVTAETVTVHVAAPPP